VDYSPFSKPVELQPTCKFCTPILLKSHSSTMSRYHMYFHITPTLILQFNNAAILQTTTDHLFDLTFDQTIHTLLNQDKAITMFADSQHNKLALFNNKTAAQDHPSYPFHLTSNTNQRHPPNNNNAARQIPAHPMQQILNVSTVEE
jgi:hypothetical protein